MSSTLSTSTASPSNTACTAGDFTRFPSSDVYCAVGSISGLPSNTSSVLSQCCKSAPVKEFANGCGFYCLSYEQSVGDLSTCLQSNGVRGNAIFCSGNNTATATGKPSTTASVTAKTSGTTTRASDAAKTGGAGSLVMASQSMSKVGLGLMGMVVLSFFTGTLL